jgi:hypothetical protein
MHAIRFATYLLPRLTAILACLLLSSPSWSQYDRGQWQILGARYGTAQRNIDVTAQLQQLAQQNATFRVTNRLFGSDPAPGVVKTLRIYARAPGGGTRTFEYFENDTVDGNEFTAWSSGNWGQGGGYGGGWGHPDSDRLSDRGQWQILGARYGTADRNVDVTARLRDLARQDARFEVTNRQFGSDPAPGVVKTLRIYARGPGGAVRTFEYGENHYVDGALFSGWSRGDWGQGGWEGGWGGDHGGGPPQPRVRIVSAQYGEGYERRDVTGLLNSMVRNGKIATRVNNDSMGGDPAPGRRKILWVTYNVAGQGQRQTSIAEGAMLVLP